MGTFILDGSRITSPDAFWDAYVAVVQPKGAEYFGRNLNALNDGLWGGPGWPGNDFVLQISNATVLEHHLGTQFVEKLRDVFAHSQSAKLVLG